MILDLFKIDILQFYAGMPSALGPFLRILSIIVDTFSSVSFLLGIRLEWQVSVPGSFTLILSPSKLIFYNFTQECQVLLGPFSFSS